MITIIGRDNGAGLSKDKDILLAHINGSQFRSIDNYHPLDKDNEVCIFTEIVEPRYYGKYNVLIPNQEWFFKHWVKELKNFQAIWVKTDLAYKLFSSMHPNVQKIGFTSVDMYDESVKKEVEFIHTQGKSSDKGTDILMKWTSDLPTLHLLSKNYSVKKSNVIMHGFVPDDEFKTLMNRCVLHICPSTMEGYGHYINEAKAMACAVITTDAAPMNELITDKKYLCKVVTAEHKSSCLGTWTRTNYDELHKVIKGLTGLELFERGQENRKEFLKNDVEFKQRLSYAISGI